jgi:peptidoglycan/xylan/chitin deacetylase (PgdA/CDA1 family)
MKHSPQELAHGIQFHHLHGGAHPEVQGSISKEQFEEVLRQVGPDRILDPTEWLTRLEEGRLSEEDVCLSFDDGLLCQYDVALPVLEKLRLKAFWFIYSGVFEGRLERMEVYRAFRCRHFSTVEEFYELFFDRVRNDVPQVSTLVEDHRIQEMLEAYPFYSKSDVRFRIVRDRVLSREQYERLMDELILERGLTPERLSQSLWMTNDHLHQLQRLGHSIGLHSYSHPTAFSALSHGEQSSEYERNFSHIRRISGRVPSAAAHPCGSYNESTIHILRGLGIRCAFRDSMPPQGQAYPVASRPHEIPRQDCATILARR